MRNIRTMTKILALAGIMALLLIVVAVVGYRTAADIRLASQDMYASNAKPAMWILDAKSFAIQNRRMLLSATKADSREEVLSYEKRVADNRKQITGLIAQYEATSLGDDERSLLAKLSDARNQANAKQDEVFAALKDGRDMREIEDRMQSKGDIAAAEGVYVETFDQLARLLVASADRIEREVAAEAERSQRVIAVVAAVSVLAGCLLAVFISRFITVPLGKTQKSIVVFSEGDLSARFDTDGRDEVAVISQNLQRMSDVLRDVIGSVNEASRNISEAAHDFSAMAEETNASVEEFRSNVDEMAVNLDGLASASEEVNASVEEVASGAQTTAERGTDIARKVDDAMTAGDAGINAVRNVVNGIGRVAESSSAATGAIMQLGERARQIQSFVAQIGSIADQTNLLALNAAIEAARAGEAGRGFAVVAEEVRKLAEDSNVAAKSIADLAGTITAEIETIVGFAQENAADSNAARDLSTQTEDAIQHMIEYLREIAGATQDLAAIAEEQAASSEEIAEAVQGMSMKIGNTASAGESIRSGVAEVAAASERVAQGAESLSTLSAQLRDELRFFKMNGESGTPQGRKNDRLMALPR